MKQLPNTNNPLVIRTDSERRDAWNKICKLIREPQFDNGHEFYAYVEFLDDRELHNLSLDKLLLRLPENYRHSFLFVVDPVTTQSPEFPVLVVHLSTNPKRTFRALPSQVQSIENNLSIANMDFDEFAHYAGQDGIFRGFPDS